MPTEAQVWAYIVQNWPWLAMNLVSTVILTKIYLKVRQSVKRLILNEQRIDRMMTVCSEQHPDKGAFIMKDKDEN